jgi:hypothetical protein
MPDNVQPPSRAVNPGTADQPAPAVEPAGVPVWPSVISRWERPYGPPFSARSAAALVVEDMRARDLVGRARYGVPLSTNNGRSALLDAYQERR